MSKHVNIMTDKTQGNNNIKNLNTYKNKCTYIQIKWCICNNRLKNCYKIKCTISINHNITRDQIGEVPMDPLEPQRAVAHSTDTYDPFHVKWKIKKTMIYNNSKPIRTK